jgi:hypothetical protein
MELRSPRWYECDCEGRPAKATFSPLNKILTTHTAPELEFLQAKWAAHLSFAAVVDLLHDVLPVDPLSSANTQRRDDWYQEILMVETTQHGVRAHGNILAQAMSGSGIEVVMR